MSEVTATGTVGAGLSARRSVGLGALRIAPKRIRLWASALVIIGLVPVLSAPTWLYYDFSAFWSAGATVGSADLVDAARHTAWQVAHGLPAAFWSYPPATAWLYWPMAQLPMGVSFWLNGLIMLALIIGSAYAAARIFGLTPALATLAALAWAPNTASIVLGQNAPLGLLLALVAIYALATDRPWLAGVATGALLYKPTLALGLLFLLLARGEWRALSAAALVGAALYLLSIPAAGGDVLWLSSWWVGATEWLPADAAGNADKAISLPGIIGRFMPGWVGLAAGGLCLLLAVPGLRRSGILEAGAAACLLGITFGPRSWGYDAALMFPFVCWLLAGGMSEPWRTRVIVAAFIVVAAWPWSWVVGFSPVAVVVTVASAWWIITWLRVDGVFRPTAGQRDSRRRAP